MDGWSEENYPFGRQRVRKAGLLSKSVCELRNIYSISILIFPGFMTLLLA